MKRNYQQPVFFRKEGILFAEFADGTLYGIREFPRLTRDAKGGVVVRKTFIRIHDGASN